MGVTDLDRFWCEVQLDLLGLPRPWDTLDRLKSVDPDLYVSLVKGEQWLLQPKRTLRELKDGWRWWLKLYRDAVQFMETKVERLAG